jgi:exopolysaccharide production protein ExoZ
LVTIGQYIATVIWPLQILRFIAALMVVYVHAAHLAVKATGSYGLFPPELPLAGQAGVDIFFVISGVIIAKTAVGLSW